jgi:C4-dicarboxylate transporter DctM subunit
VNAPVGIVLFGVFFGLMVLGVPVAVALGVSSIVTIAAFDLEPLISVGQGLVGATDKWTLLAIPLFVLAGNILAKTGVSERLVDLARSVVGGVRGGLALATVTVCVFFAGISGSGPADVAALGALLIPALVKEGYSKPFASGLLAAGGGIGIIIPPSIALIIYGVIAEANISNLFKAGILPGILVGVSLAVVSLIKAPPRDRRPERPAFFPALWRASWGLLAPVILLGGIYTGIFSPTEAAAVAVVYSLLVGLVVYRDVRLRALPAILLESASTSATVMFVVACAAIFSRILNTEGLAEAFSKWMLSLSESKVSLLLLMNLVLLVAGLFMDAISIFYIFVPIFLPVAKQLGVNDVHFGIIFTVNMAIGQVTPPIGVNLFVAARIGGVSVAGISRAAVPLILAEIAALLVITFWPGLSLCLVR